MARKARTECAELAEQVEHLHQIVTKRAMRENAAKARSTRLSSYDEADLAAQRVLELAARQDSNLREQSRAAPANERSAAREEARQRGFLQ